MLSPKTLSPLDVTAQLERIRGSDAFAGSERLITLLTYLVEETLAGRGDDLREAVIGNAVYRRDPPYDPRIDSTVRVEARRLRAKLKDYFASEGRKDPIYLSIPTGSYTPAFAANTPAKREPSFERRSRRAIFESGAGAAVAILPLRPLSADPRVRQFADGLTDELIYLLGTEPGLRVPSRSLVFPYAEGAQQPAALAAEIGVDAVLQGTVREENARVKVTIELSDRSGFMVLSDRFEGAWEQRLELQESIAATLLSRVRLDNSRMRAHELSPGPGAVEAHAKVYRARRLLDKQLPASLRQALSIFEDVAAAAPDYARAQAGIADCQCDLYRIGVLDHAAVRIRAGEAARRALEIDDRSAEAFTAAATVAAWLERDRAKAEDYFERALELGTTSRTARIYGVFLTVLGRQEEAEQLFAEARAMEPFSEQQDIAEAVSRYQSRRFDRLTNDLGPAEKRSQPAEALSCIALAHHFSGHAAAAEACSLEVSRTLSNHPLLAFAHAELQAWLGRPAEARVILAGPQGKGSNLAHATLAASIGAADKVLHFLQAAIERRELAAVWIRFDARFDAFRDRPEFQSLLAGLEAQHAAWSAP